jgi:hypothetical protein
VTVPWAATFEAKATAPARAEILEKDMSKEWQNSHSGDDKVQGCLKLNEEYFLLQSMKLIFLDLKWMEGSDETEKTVTKQIANEMKDLSENERVKYLYTKR